MQSRSSSVVAAPDELFQPGGATPTGAQQTGANAVLAASSSSPLLCEECGVNEASVFCLPCRHDFCADCDSLVHGLRVFADHSPRGPLASKPLVLPPCPHHGDEMKLFCSESQCRSLCCGLCAAGPSSSSSSSAIDSSSAIPSSSASALLSSEASGPAIKSQQHRGHKVYLASSPEVTAVQRQLIEDEISNCRADAEALQQRITSLSDAEYDLLESQELFLSALRRDFQHVHTMVALTEERLLKEVQEFVEQKVELLRGQVEQVQNAMDETLAAYKQARQCLRLSHPVAFLSQVHELSQRLNRASDLSTLQLNQGLMPLVPLVELEYRTQPREPLPLPKNQSVIQQQQQSVASSQRFSDADEDQLSHSRSHRRHSSSASSRASFDVASSSARSSFASSASPSHAKLDDEEDDEENFEAGSSNSSSSSSSASSASAKPKSSSLSSSSSSSSSSGSVTSIVVGELGVAVIDFLSAFRLRALQ